MAKEISQSSPINASLGSISSVGKAAAILGIDDCMSLASFLDYLVFQIRPLLMPAGSPRPVLDDSGTSPPSSRPLDSLLGALASIFVDDVRFVGCAKNDRNIARNRDFFCAAANDAVRPRDRTNSEAVDPSLSLCWQLRQQRTTP